MTSICYPGDAQMFFFFFFIQKTVSSGSGSKKPSPETNMFFNENVLSSYAAMYHFVKLACQIQKHQNLRLQKRCKYCWDFPHFYLVQQQHYISAHLCAALTRLPPTCKLFETVCTYKLDAATWQLFREKLVYPFTENLFC